MSLFSPSFLNVYSSLFLSLPLSLTLSTLSLSLSLSRFDSFIPGEIKISGGFADASSTAVVGSTYWILGHQRHLSDKIKP